MKRSIFSILIVLLVAVVALPMAVQGQTRGPSSGFYRGKGQKITVHGKIGFMKALGGYYIKGEKPSEEIMIENPNPKVLEQLYRSGKSVSVEGHLTAGAGRMAVERIDGATYSTSKGASSESR